MHQIWKFPIKVTDDVQVIEGPGMYEPLSVAEQNGKLCLWARVSTTQPVSQVRIRV